MLFSEWVVSMISIWVGLLWLGCFGGLGLVFVLICVLCFGFRLLGFCGLFYIVLFRAGCLMFALCFGLF